MSGSIELRDYQEHAIDAVREVFRTGQRKTLLVLPTGAGKTVVFCSIVAKMKPATRAVIMAHTRELIDQIADTLREMVPEKKDVGIVRATENAADARFVVATVQTIRNDARLKAVGARDLVIVDEGHHATAETYRSILERMESPSGGQPPLVLGVTATPDRGDGESLSPVFESVAFSVSIEQLITDGYLVPPRGRRLALYRNLDKMRRKDGDLTNADLGENLRNASGHIHIARAVKTYAPDRKSIVFLPDVKTAAMAAAELRRIGILAESVSGKTPAKERARIVADVRSGKLQAVTTCMLLTEGFDAPILDCAVIARPTTSRALYQQMAGRVLRPHEGKKDALILDMAGVTDTLSLHSVASLIDSLPDGTVVDNGESVMEALERTRRNPTTPTALAGAELVAFKRELFNRSPLSWVTRDNTLFTLRGSPGFAIHINDESGICTLYRVRANNDTPGARRDTPGLNFTRIDAHPVLADAIRRADEEATRYGSPEQFGESWKSQPVTRKQRRFLRARGVSAAEVNAVKTKGEASDLITWFEVLRDFQGQRLAGEHVSQSAPSPDGHTASPTTGDISGGALRIARPAAPALRG